MRVGFGVALIAILCAGCAPQLGNIVGGNEASESRSGGAAADAVVTVATDGGSACATRWNGEAVSIAELTARGLRLIEGAIERAGGIPNMDMNDLPKVRIEAAPALTFACVGPVIAAIQQAGAPEILLKPSGSVNQPVSVHSSLTSSGAEPARATIEVLPGGRFAWNGEATDRAGVRTRSRAMAGTGAPPGQLAVIVAPDVSFAAAFELLETVADAQPILLPPGSVLPPPEQRGRAPFTSPPPPPDPLRDRR